MIPLAFAAFSAIASAQETNIFAFLDANLITLNEEEILTGQTVIVVDGHIGAIGSEDSVDVPSGSFTIDASGGYLMPGLTEMHVPGTDDPQYLQDVLSCTSPTA